MSLNTPSSITVFDISMPPWFQLSRRVGRCCRTATMAAVMILRTPATILLAVIFGPDEISIRFFLTGGAHFYMYAANVYDQNSRVMGFPLVVRQAVCQDRLC